MGFGIKSDKNYLNPVTTDWVFIKYSYLALPSNTDCELALDMNRPSKKSLKVTRKAYYVYIN